MVCCCFSVLFLDKSFYSSARRIQSSKRHHAGWVKKLFNIWVIFFCLIKLLDNTIRGHHSARISKFTQLHHRRNYAQNIETMNEYNSNFFFGLTPSSSPFAPSIVLLFISNYILGKFRLWELRNCESLNSAHKRVVTMVWSGL